jgi:hypothetical protein
MALASRTYFVFFGSPLALRHCRPNLLASGCVVSQQQVPHLLPPRSVSVTLEKAPCTDRAGLKGLAAQARLWAGHLDSSAHTARSSSLGFICPSGSGATPTTPRAAVDSLDIPPSSDKRRSGLRRSSARPKRSSFRLGAGTERLRKGGGGLEARLPVADIRSMVSNRIAPTCASEFRSRSASRT